MKVFLHAGCGVCEKSKTTKEFAQDSWREIRLDISPLSGPDILGSITNVDTLASGSVDAVYCSHLLEHLYRHEFMMALRESARVLKADGYLLMRGPNLRAIAEYILQDRLDDVIYRTNAGIPVTPHDMLYGHNKFIESGRVEMAHRSGFTPQSLLQLLVQAGFSSALVVPSDSQMEIWAYASKQPMDNEALGNAIRLHVNVAEEMV